VGSGTYWDYATIKYNSSGAQQWVSRYNSSANADDIAFALGVDGSGNVYVTGGSYGGTNFDYATVKYNSTGAQQWEQRYFGPGNGLNDYSYALVLDGSGNVYITGYSWGSASYYDYTTIKYNPAGNQQWLARFNGPGNYNDIAESIALDGSGNVYVTGSVSASTSNRDYGTVKYSQLVGITPVSNQIPEAFALEQNYPNPFNPATNIKFDIAFKGDTKLLIYDVLGREVEKLVNQELQAGSYSVNWDASNYPSGIYFYKIETKGFTQTKKMILMK